MVKHKRHVKPTLHTSPKYLFYSLINLSFKTATNLRTFDTFYGHFPIQKCKSLEQIYMYKYETYTSSDEGMSYQMLILGMGWWRDDTCILSPTHVSIRAFQTRVTTLTRLTYTRRWIIRHHRAINASECQRAHNSMDSKLSCTKSTGMTCTCWDGISYRSLSVWILDLCEFSKCHKWKKNLHLWELMLSNNTSTLH